MIYISVPIWQQAIIEINADLPSTAHTQSYQMAFESKYEAKEVFPWKTFI